ncbi:MAG: cytochrome c oxidase assembly protein [Pseudoxanthomonas suwonensis]|nr:cytochrome c oxidase assembly protein [Pseudoxanthomonas suwonensis]
MQSSSPPPVEKKKPLGLGKLLAVSLAAFAFTFSLVPLYRIACEQILGIRVSGQPADAGRLASAQQERWVTVQFDGTVNSRLPWGFLPNQTEMRVKVGEPYEATYHAINNSPGVVVGSATPSVAPARASKYFNKTECFCFTAQTLQAGQAQDMPVRFIIDPALPRDVNTVILSYTFFRNDTLTEQAASTALARSAP